MLRNVLEEIRPSINLLILVLVLSISLWKLFLFYPADLCLSDWPILILNAAHLCN